MLNLIKVQILSDGVTAREVNSLGTEPIDKYVDQDNGDSGPFYNSKYLKWEELESKLRTFKIAGVRPEWSDFDSKGNKRIYTTYTYHGTQSFIIGEDCKGEILKNDEFTIRLIMY